MRAQLAEIVAMAEQQMAADKVGHKIQQFQQIRDDPVSIDWIVSILNLILRILLLITLVIIITLVEILKLLLLQPIFSNRNLKLNFLIASIRRGVCALAEAVVVAIVVHLIFII